MKCLSVRSLSVLPFHKLLGLFEAAFVPKEFPSTKSSRIFSSNSIEIAQISEHWKEAIHPTPPRNLGTISCSSQQPVMTRPRLAANGALWAVVPADPFDRAGACGRSTSEPRSAKQGIRRGRSLVPGTTPIWGFFLLPRLDRRCIREGQTVFLYLGVQLVGFCDSLRFTGRMSERCPKT